MKTTFLPTLFMSMLLNTGAGATPLAKPAAQVLLNVPYGKEAAQHMDIYLPADRSQSKTKSLVLIHGGGWSSGSRHAFTSYLDSFRRRMPDYAVFNVDYRLVTAVTAFPAQENDIKAAVDFIAAHTGTYHVNPSKFVLLGVSAGAHLALLQAYKNASPAIAAVIDFFGPTDLTGMYNKPWNPMIPHLLETLTGGTPQTKPSAYRNSSAVSFINASTPPTLIFHGRQDYIVNISQSQLLHQRLQEAGVANKLVVYDNGGHGWFGATLSDSFDKIQTFLSEHVQ